MKRVHVVLGGGGVRVASYAGALRELEAQREIVSISGNSAGALVAALVAAGQTGAELEKRFSHFRFMSVVGDKASRPSPHEAGFSRWPVSIW